MFTESAELYDAIYSFKNYELEAAQVAALVRAACPDARTLLDVACGTGEHARRFTTDHGFAADGLDIDAGLLEIARRKHPAGRFFEADMSDFALATRYDAIVCLFSSIGYLRTLDRVTRALTCFRQHLAPGGVILVEPWFAPGIMQNGRVDRNIGEGDGVRVERVGRTEISDRLSRLYFDYRIETAGGVRQVSEIHELGLFTIDEMREAFRAAGLAVSFDPVGLSGRGLWTAH